MSFTAHRALEDVRSEVVRLKRTVCIVRLRRWFVELAFDVLKSERIFWKRSVRSDLLGVEMRIGKRVCRSLHIGFD